MSPFLLIGLRVSYKGVSSGLGRNAHIWHRCLTARAFAWRRAHDPV